MKLLTIKHIVYYLAREALQLRKPNVWNRSNMKIITKQSLSRGKALIDYAFSRGETPDTYETADLIGICAAYIARGQPGTDVFNVIEDRLNVGLAIDVERTLETFCHSEGRGLWTRGPTLSDIRFTHPKLRAYYPGTQRPKHATADYARYHELDLGEPF